MSDDLTRMSARDVVGQLRQATISPHDALDEAEARIDDVDHLVNALPTRCFGRAREHADRLLKVPADERGILCGLPVPIKDLNQVAGVRNTFGSMARRDFVPERSGLLVDHLEGEGAVIYAMSNTPEFGAGGNTFNDVFGPTRNPYDLRLTAGGSSGGAAAALASGTAWLAHGSDLAGSLRTPASFCGVTSLRPSPGLIATGPSTAPFFVHPQQGPMARDIADLALFADAMAGPNPMAGLTKPRAERSFRTEASEPVRPTRVAFSVDLGVTETSPEVADVFAKAMSELEHSGCKLAPDHPNLVDAAAAFEAPRALLYATNLGPELADLRDILKPELVWNVEQGLALDGVTIRESVAAQGRVFQAATEFMADYDLLVCPAAIVVPFPVEERYVGFLEGRPASEYFRWLTIVSAITATTLPVITVPCGHTAAGLPVGIQLIGKPHGEGRLFAMASYIEAVFGIGARIVEQPTADSTVQPQHRSSND